MRASPAVNSGTHKLVESDVYDGTVKLRNLGPDGFLRRHEQL